MKGEGQKEGKEWKGGDIRYAEVRGERGTTARCRERDAALGFARRVESSLGSNGPSGVSARETYSTEIVPITVTERTSPTTLQENITVS